MPTFLFFKEGIEIGKVVGADPNKLRVRSHVSSPLLIEIDPTDPL